MPFTERNVGKDPTARQELMKTQLERILAAPSLSRDSFEIASKSLR